MGRKKALFAGAAVSLLGGALQAGSVHIAMYLVARLLTGYGIGKSSKKLEKFAVQLTPIQAHLCLSFRCTRAKSHHRRSEACLLAFTVSLSALATHLPRG